MSLIPFAVLLALMAPLGTLADDPSAPTGRWFPHVLAASLLSLTLSYGWVKLNLHLRRARLWGPRHRLTWFVLASAQLMVAFALLLFSVSYFADRLWWQTLALAMGGGVVGWGTHLYGATVWRTRLSKLSLAGAAVLLGGLHDRRPHAELSAIPMGHCCDGLFAFRPGLPASRLAAYWAWMRVAPWKTPLPR